jgi:ATP phosphoribosyltransferase regulatory subunit
MSADSPTLLPNGLIDLLPPHAENEAAIIERLMKKFGSFGYARVKPPLVEFEESLLNEGPGKALSRQTFRLMDPVSRRMMGVRADATAQIARIAGSRLAMESRPLRLSYAADVLRVNGTQLRPERQFCQVGCELIGADSLNADVETPLVALIALAAAGAPPLSIDLTVPTLVDHLYEETSTDAATRDLFDGLIEKRDRDSIIAQGGDAAKMIAAMMGGKHALADIALTGRAAGDRDRLLSVAKELRAALNIYGLQDIQITIDPLERRGFEYQTGVSFTIFAIGGRGELGRGGRYDAISPGKPAETATGFTLYMDTILRSVPEKQAGPRQTVAAEAGWDEIKALQNQGVDVFRAGK